MMMVVKKALDNGAWKNWLLGIVGTILASLIVNAIAFQRATRENIATNEERIKALERRDEQIIKYFQQRIEEQMRYRDAADVRIEKRLEELEKRSGMRLQSEESKPFHLPP